MGALIPTHCLCDFGLPCPLWGSASPSWAHLAFLRVLFAVALAPSLVSRPEQARLSTETLGAVLSLAKLVEPRDGRQVKGKGNIKCAGGKKEPRNGDEMRRERKMSRKRFSRCCRTGWVPLFCTDPILWVAPGCRWT